MKADKKVLSIQTKPEIIEKLKAIATKENRSQAKQIDHLIEQEFERLGLKLK